MLFIWCGLLCVLFMRCIYSCSGARVSLPLPLPFLPFGGVVACASIWFSYVLIYLTAVLGISQKLAGVLLLTGQVFDAMATPTVGILSDLTTKVSPIARAPCVCVCVCVCVSGACSNLMWCSNRTGARHKQPLWSQRRQRRP